MQQPVGQGRFAMVNVGNDAEIADMVRHERRKYTRFFYPLRTRSATKKLTAKGFEPLPYRQEFKAQMDCHRITSP
jgi:hypothetical protein